MAEIDPKILPPIFPYGQASFGSWLFQGLGFDPETNQWKFEPSTQYPGALTADPNATKLKDVWGGWSPQGDPGLNWLQNYFQNNQGGVGQHDPLSTQLMDWGGTDSMGTHAMQLMTQHGVAGEAAGQGVQSLSQNGMSSVGSGGDLARFAAGDPGGAAKFLVPFLTGGINSAAGLPGAGQMPGGRQFPLSYQAPNIQARQVQRKA